MPFMPRFSGTAPVSSEETDEAYNFVCDNPDANQMLEESLDWLYDFNAKADSDRDYDDMIAENLEPKLKRRFYHRHPDADWLTVALYMVLDYTL